MKKLNKLELLDDEKDYQELLKEAKENGLLEKAREYMKEYMKEYKEKKEQKK